MSDYLIAYPASLPPPVSAPCRPAQRVRRSDLAGPVVQAARERDFRGEQTVTFLFTDDEAQTFDDWWRLQLREGGQAFQAPWPLPQGYSHAAVRKCMRAPVWARQTRRTWRVTLQCEVLGRHLPPQGDSSTVLGLAEWYVWAEYLDRAIAILPPAGELFETLQPWHPWALSLDSAISELPGA